MQKNNSIQKFGSYKRKWKILIVNQHGENRGDESAKRAMINGINRRLGRCQFTLVCQFRDRRLKIEFEEDVKIIPMLIPIKELPALFLYTFLKIWELDIRFLLGENSRKIIQAYDDADVVLSAPGGPYFGDLYRGFFSLHEIAHWYMVVLAKLFKKSVLLYAPSAGPFEIPLMNGLRRLLYGLFSIVTARESISQRHLQTLLPKRKVHLTADAAIQRPLKAGDRKEFFGKRDRNYQSIFVVAISANDYKYPLSRKPTIKKKEYEECLIRTMVHLHKKKNAHFLMFPQLYGKYHSDVGFLDGLGQRLPRNASWEMVDPELNSDQQQEIFGICNFCIASRYHPQIFAALQSLPLIAICYEHKQFGFMKALGMENFSFDIYNLNFNEVRDAVNRALCDAGNISNQIKKNLPRLIQQSELTSELVCNFIINEIR